MLIHATKSDQRANVRVNDPWSLTQLSVAVWFVFWQEVISFQTARIHFTVLLAFQTGIFYALKELMIIFNRRSESLNCFQLLGETKS